MTPASAFVCLALVFCVAAAAVAADGPADIGSRLQLMVSPYLIESMKGVSLKLHPPVPREVVFTLDAPYEGGESGYVMMLKMPDGTFRMYYRAGGETTQEFTALATSKDGIHFERPALGMLEFAGSKQNNLFYKADRKSYGESHNFTPFLDSNPAAKAEERWKAVALGWSYLPDGEKARALNALVSPDGINWKLVQQKPVITEGSFDSQNVAFWDPNRKKYACYFRASRNGVRAVNVAWSDDFRKWSAPVMCEYPGEHEHFYTNAIEPYFREPSLYVGFPMRFVPERASIGVDGRKTDGLSDGVFISSRDGVNFDRTFMEAFIRPGLDPLNWGSAHGNNTPAWGVVQTGPGEMSIYWAEHYLTTPAVRRGTLRLDGFASVNAPYAGGEFVTKPLTFSGKDLVLNVSTSAIGSVQVEVQSADGQPVKGFELAACPPIWGDEIERPVRWNGAGDLSSLAGKPVRLRFVMKDADLYAFRVKP